MYLISVQRSHWRVSLGNRLTSFSRLERDARRRGALSVYWDSNALTLNKQLKKLYKEITMFYNSNFL